MEYIMLSLSATAARRLTCDVTSFHCRYEVVVVAIDGGEQPKSGSTILNITVLDVNDNAPIFDNDTYEVGLTSIRTTAMLSVLWQF